jgi:hypothetical protein
VGPCVQLKASKLRTMEWSWHAGAGMDVVMHRRDADGRITQEHIKHNILLDRACGNAPALQ